MFDFIQDASKAVSGWFGGDQPQQKAPSGASTAAKQAGASTYQQQQAALSPGQQGGYSQQAAKQAPGGGGGGGWWSQLTDTVGAWWAGGDKDGGGGDKGGQAKGEAKGGGGGGRDIAAERKRQDQLYAAQGKVRRLQENQRSYQRYVERRDKWDAEYAKHKRNPHKFKMPEQIQPYTPPNPEVIDPTHPAFHAELAHSQDKYGRLKGG